MIKALSHASVRGSGLTYETSSLQRSGREVQQSQQCNVPPIKKSDHQKRSMAHWPLPSNAPSDKQTGDAV